VSQNSQNISLPGAHKHWNYTAYGTSTIVAGGGDDNLNIIAPLGHGEISVTGGNDQLTIVGKSGTVIAGNGNDSILVTGNGAVTVGHGNDQISLYGSGTISQTGAHGNDTINFGTGNDTLYEAGTATVHGAFGSATVHNGILDVDKVGGVWDVTETGGPATLMGGTGKTDLTGGSGVTFVDGPGNDTMTGTGNNWFEFNGSGAGSHDTITAFTGSDNLYLEGYSLGYLQSHGDITTHGSGPTGYSQITLPDGTKVRVDGVTDPNELNIKTHKP
jgi:Ca2+-binding RTX toxin-like protein